MVIHEVNVECLAAFKPENYSPVRAHGNRPEACQLALERMESERCIIEIAYLFGCVHQSQDLSDFPCMLRVESFCIVMLEKLSQTFVLEAFDHPASVPLPTVKRDFTGVKVLRWKPMFLFPIWEGSMKMTIEISDPLLREVRRLAAREGVTLRTLVERGLHHVLAETKHAAPFKLRRASFKGSGLQAALRDASWDSIRELAYGDRGG
jgi:hypothetical protein